MLFEQQLVLFSLWHFCPCVHFLEGTFVWRGHCFKVNLVFVHQIVLSELAFLSKLYISSNILKKKCYC